VRAGIAVTKDSEESGLFGVIPGSHRANVSNDPRTLPPELERRMVYCEPGDVHIHLSCTFHRGTPPKSVSRRVFYSDFLLPPRPGDSDEEVSPYRAGDGRVGAVGRGVAAAARAQSDDV